MDSKPFCVLQVKPVPRGTDAFEAKRADILQAFSEKVPHAHFLSKDIIDNAPPDVSNIPVTCGILSPLELAITENYDAVGLAAAIASRKFTAVSVATAFSKRAIIAHQLTCCLTQWFMAEAIEQAAHLDAHLDATGKTVGPLHGVPVSIKEHIPIAGKPSSAGCLGSIAIDSEDCQMTAILRSMGAVFYCKTNQPQTIMHLESDSLWGRVLNPFNTRLSAGGSTGGEAALIAMKGSVLGNRSHQSNGRRPGLAQLLSDPEYAGAVEVTSFKPFGAADAWSKIRRTYWPDGGQGARDEIVATGEPLHPLSEWIWKDAEPHGMLTAQDVALMRKDRDDFRIKFARSWAEQDVDVVLGPAYIGPACAHDTAFTWTYTSLYNFIDYPGVVFPTPIVTQRGEKYDASYVPLSDACREARRLWDESDFEGAPINLQLVARKYHDISSLGPWPSYRIS
ncbi:hypothetical protein BJF96_g2226 [Verticillium dahliae]|uniref:Amidase domain-containing protein n=1 Tax=Verticillium dahliae TaxID=27337 RepID=A0AA44WRH8_VERDA|nr:hypothetical protein BJF96_g2226 [Verticillium dahliae]